MNLPNKITVFRIFMIPFFVACMLIKEIPYNEIAAGVIFIIAALSDLVDGKIARHYNLVTNFGKFMDPLADKILACSALVMLVQFGKVDAWMVCIVLAREFIISGFRLIAASNGIVISASIYGKIKTITQLFAISFILLNSTRLIKIPLNIDIILWYISVVFTIISAIDYISKNIKVLDLKNI